MQHLDFPKGFPIVQWHRIILHSSSPKHSQWIKSPQEVVGVLTEMQGVLKQAGYVYTVAIDKKITIYSKNASRVETIISRRGGDDVEVDRTAISFEFRREDKGWVIISTTAQPTKSMKLQDVYLN